MCIRDRLGDIDISSAGGALIRVVGGPDMTVSEAEKVAELVNDRINPRARIIWGCSVDPNSEGKLKVMVVLTGVKTPDLKSVLDNGGDKTKNADDFVH